MTPQLQERTASVPEAGIFVNDFNRFTSGDLKLLKYVLKLEVIDFIEEKQLQDFRRPLIYKYIPCGVLKTPRR